LAVSKIKSALKQQDFRILKTSKRYDDGTESCSVTGVEKIFLIVAA